MKKQNLLSLILAAVMLSGTLASCGDKGTATTSGASKTPAQTSGSTDSGLSEKDFTYIENYVKELSSDHDFGGETFTIVGRGLDPDDETSRNGGFPAVEEITNRKENDALWRRQKALEDAFNVDIVGQNVDQGEYDGAGIPTAMLVTQDVTAGLQTYDLVEGNLMNCGHNLLNDKVIMDAEEIEGFDFSQSWWLNDIEDQLSLGDKLYFLTGKISTNSYGDAACLLFNKAVAKDYNIEEPYGLVNSGEWTFDKMNEISQVIPANGDVYRLMLGGNSAINFYIGAGYSVTEKNADDIPEAPSALTSEQVDYITKLGSILGDTSIMYNYTKPSGYGVSSASDMEEDVVMFPDGRVLFYNTSMGNVAGLRKYDVEFGVVPIPKKDASQQNYVSYTSAWDISGFFIPNNVANLDKIGYLVEAMAALSEEYLEPEYYDSSLRGRGTFDIDSKDMLDIIYQNKKLDAADIFCSRDSETVVDVINVNCEGSQENIASGYTISARLTNRELKTLSK